MTNIGLAIINLVLSSFYSLSFQDIDGNTVNMNSFIGKRVLITNVATGSDKVVQLAGLQQLQQQFNDSLVVIVFPSNSFGNENMTNAEIKEFCSSVYHNTFLMASKTSVWGTTANPVFSWLANQSQNGQMNAAAGADFVKFLISKDGELIGTFSSKVSPLDSAIIEGITTSF